MIRILKKSLYFFVAGYFRFFAKIQLKKWHPQVIVITGSNGKTTTLHLLEAQLGAAARYSHHANSSFGIPFDILDLKRTTFAPQEWLRLFVLAPVRAWKKPYEKNIYVVEADCDRPGEGRFLATLLQPEVVIWLSSARTHSQNFDKVVASGKFTSVDAAIAHEFGMIAHAAKKLVLWNGDNTAMREIMESAHVKTVKIEEKKLLQDYEVSRTGTVMTIAKKKYSFGLLLPQENWYSLYAMEKIMDYVGKKSSTDLRGFILPPGRSSLLRGQKSSVIVDSSYNTNVASVEAVLRMVKQIHGGAKWLILGDLTEQGRNEASEHEKIADLVAAGDFVKIILVGPRLRKYTLPKLTLKMNAKNIVSVLGPKEALEIITKQLQGGELLVFKGARFLEGVIEHLLADPDDVKKLCRRENIWVQRRQQWGL
ncbi:MAG: hypothetical protein A3F54_04320 [Candidatus Kerfeldbacteria bacterium RIFCSPHIGHO2_12_FULL_48_17]|uniref:Mur ligase C-terminal domain-containing protein n=1 Tax=Candidatus Kerfeldbacteria bacterium RIFCSPHIGHO2_12_FULL_48_17 TaxID=1798542 RepID=A0A1G2B7D3_9BACT|nr:MAG: hypothetical protein A3F54_04320 [Candidatus Kerfeldbacteria bacterium RIFCSPHIGHO2_12_FULL_48_17]